MGLGARSAKLFSKDGYMQIRAGNESPYFAAVRVRPGWDPLAARKLPYSRPRSATSSSSQPR